MVHRRNLALIVPTKAPATVDRKNGISINPRAVAPLSFTGVVKATKTDFLLVTNVSEFVEWRHQLSAPAAFVLSPKNRVLAKKLKSNGFGTRKPACVIDSTTRAVVEMKIDLTRNLNVS